MKNEKLAVVLALCTTASVFGETITVDDLHLTADTTVDVAAGSTQNVVRITGGAYTLTKTGGGTLNIYWTSNENARVVVEEGVVALPRYAKPTAVFDKACFHVDASDASTLETVAIGGTNFVVRWLDCSGNGAYATNAHGEARMPFVNPVEKLNGLPFVDFGSLRTVFNTNGVGEALGYGASMQFNANKSAAEGITVAADTPDVVNGDWLACPEHSKIRAMSFFSNNSYLWGTGTRGIIESGGTPKIHQYDNQSSFYNGLNILDGEVLAKSGSNATYNRRYPAGFHVFSHAPTDARTYTHLAEARCYETSGFNSIIYGGQRIAEYALFPECLSQAERDELFLYLKMKWLPRKFASLEVKSGAAFDASDGGISCNDIRNEDGATLLFGVSAVKVNPVRPWKTVVHFDASAADTMDTVEAGGTNFVQKWSDWAGNGVYADNKNGDARMPFVNPTETLNGRPFVDFGSLRTPYNTNDVGEALGYGASLKFNAKKSAAEGITVAADTPDVVNGDWIACTERSKMFGMSFFSSDDFTFGTGSRGLIESGGTPKIHQYDNQSAFYGGTNYLDGVKMTASGVNATYNTRYPTGFHVFSHSPKTPYSYTHLAEALCYVKISGVVYKPRVYGGQRIAEYALYKPKLTDDERTRAYRALRWKWFAETPEARSYAALSVAEDASYEVLYETLSVDGALTLGGKVGAIAVSASNVVVSSECATIAAPLTLAAGAVLEIPRLANGSFALLSADSVVAEGDVTVVLTADDWRGLGRGAHRIVAGPVTGGGTWRVVCVGEDRIGVSLQSGSDGVTVTFTRGMIISFR